MKMTMSTIGPIVMEALAAAPCVGECRVELMPEKNKLRLPRGVLITLRCAGNEHRIHHVRKFVSYDEMIRHQIVYLAVSAPALEAAEELQASCDCEVAP